MARNYKKRPGGKSSQGKYSNNANPKQLQNNRNRYITMAKEAAAKGDRILAENYYQHAEHYTRALLLIEERQAKVDAEKAASIPAETVQNAMVADSANASN